MPEVQKRSGQPTPVAIELPPPMAAQPTWKNRALLTLTFLANLYYIYAPFYPALRPDLLYRPDLFKWAVSLVNVGLFGAVLLQPPLPPARQRSAREEVDAPVNRS